MGLPVGEKLLELTFNREKGNSSATNGGKRELGIVNMLHFINGTIWKTLFGRQADGLEQSNNDDSEYWILDKQPVTNRFTSVGKQAYSGPNCAFYIAGILEGFLCAANLQAKVTPVINRKTEEQKEDGGQQNVAESGAANPYSDGNISS